MDDTICLLLASLWGETDMSKTLCLLAFLTIFASLWCPPATAQCVDYGDYLRAAAQYSLPGDAVAVAHYEGWFQDYVAVANQEFGLRIFDLTDPYRPQLVSTTITFGSAQDVVFDSIFCFMAAGQFGLVVVRLVDVENPTQATSLELPGEAFALEKVGNYLFLASGTAGLHVIDVTQVSFPYPFVAAHLPLEGDIRAVTVVGEIAYLCDVSHENGLYMVDISDPLNPAVLGSIDVPGAEYDVDVADGFAYLAMSGTGNMEVVDVSDPTSAQLVASLNLNSSSEGICLDGTRALVANTFYGLQIVDISDPYNPLLETQIDTPGQATDVIKVDDMIYIADTSGGLQVLAAPTMEPPPLYTTLDLEGSVRGLAISGDHCLVASYGSGLKIVDFSDPQTSFVTASYDPGYVTRVVTEGQLAFVAVYTFGLKVLDITDPGQPVEIGSLPSPNQPWHIATADGLVFVAEKEEYVLRIVDVSDPTAPSTLSTFPLEFAENVNGMQASDGNVYFSSQPYGLKIVDVHDPANPVLAAQRTDLENARTLWLANDKVYVSDRYGIKIYDVTDPNSPTPVGSFATIAAAEGLTVLDNIAYVTSYNAGFRAYDVTHTDDVWTVGGVEHGFSCYNIAATPGIVLSANSHSLRLAPTHCTAVTALDESTPTVPGSSVLQVAVHPNPFNPRTNVTFTVTQQGRVRLGIYDLRGRRLISLTDRVYHAGSHNLTWDGRDQKGQNLASGHYLVRAEAHGIMATERLMLVR
jgi:hypothetical protein